MLLWLVARIIYFSVVFFGSVALPDPQTFICFAEIVQNLPIVLMYLCVSIFHRFLLRMYIVMIKRDTKQLRFWINFYCYFMATMELVSEMGETTAICMNYKLVH